VVLDFSSNAASAEPAYQLLGTAKGGNKPSSLSLNACCRIVEQHCGGRLLSQPSGSGYAAFRLELPVATKTSSDSSPSINPIRAAAGTGF
jgi:hypothetical protein